MVPRHALRLHVVLEDLGGPDVLPADQPARPILGDVRKDVLRLAGHGDGVEAHEEAQSGNAPDDLAAHDEHLRRAGRVQAEDFHDLVAVDPDTEVLAVEVHCRLLLLMALPADGGASGLRPLCPSPAYLSADHPRSCYAPGVL